jgi:hypothetical protein
MTAMIGTTSQTLNSSGMPVKRRSLTIVRTTAAVVASVKVIDTVAAPSSTYADAVGNATADACATPFTAMLSGFEFHDVLTKRRRTAPPLADSGR